MIVFSEMRGQNKIFGSFWKMNGQNILFGPLISENSIVTPPLKFYDCLVFSWIINSYLLVAVFEFLVVRMIPIHCCFYFLVTVSLSAVIVNKKFFALIFQTQHSYLRYSKREVKYVNVILFRIACYTKKIQNCPPKDIFLKFERKAHNHSTLIITFTIQRFP